MWSLLAISFNIGLSAVGTEIVLLEVFQVCQKTLMVLGLMHLIDLEGNHGQGIHSINTHATLDAAPTLVAIQPGHLLLLHEIIRRAMNVAEAIDLLSCEMRGCSEDVLVLLLLW